MGNTTSFWKGRRVFLTGHTGFKGAWLALWLHRLGAVVSGYSLPAPTKPSLFELARVEELVPTVYGDIRDGTKLAEAMRQAKPEVVLHLAAQPIVYEGYAKPVETYETNVMGTVHVLEAVRRLKAEGVDLRSVVVVTTDKCYENREWEWGYRETDRLGGSDPYSNSKACAELVAYAYRASFFPAPGFPHVATARAGNVIGGGDWAARRLVPDTIESLLEGRRVTIRSPHAIRPWQHVLEPLRGYLTLAEKLADAETGDAYADGWNFGPEESDARTVEWIVRRLCGFWGTSPVVDVKPEANFKEHQLLRLDNAKAKRRLGWTPRWDADDAVRMSVEWARRVAEGGDPRAVTLEQIGKYETGRNSYD
ncbi:CDP-glucose 4,6-dehydratase [Paenibacillus sp. TRM 82003]|nr:CDP-glucose 4,6-dehydratase [Paenibacillus sp. TRM 82003]